MNGTRMLASAMLACGVAGTVGCGFAAAASTHTPQQINHASAPLHHSHNYASGSGWHGYHHGYGFYGYWPWYFPWTYGYATPYYGTSFLADAPVSYVGMAPEESGIVQPATSWYYCRSPEGYFPYVKTCPSGWQTVPIQPVPPASAAPAPAAPAK